MRAEDVIAHYSDQMPDEYDIQGEGHWLRLDSRAAHNPRFCYLNPFLYPNRAKALTGTNPGLWPCALFALHLEQGWQLEVEDWEVGKLVRTLSGCYEERILALINAYVGILDYDAQRRYLGDYHNATHSSVCGLASRDDGTYEYLFSSARGGIWGISKYDVVQIVNLDSGRAEEPNGRRRGKSALRYPMQAAQGRLEVIRAIRRDYPDWDAQRITKSLPRERYLVIGSQQAGIYGHINHTGCFMRTLEGALNEWHSELVPELICDLETGELRRLKMRLSLGRHLWNRQGTQEGATVAALLGI